MQGFLLLGQKKARNSVLLQAINHGLYGQSHASIHFSILLAKAT